MVALLFAVVPMKVCELRLLRLEAILGPGSASQVWLLQAEEGDNLEEEEDNFADREGGHRAQVEEYELQHY